MAEKDNEITGLRGHFLPEKGVCPLLTGRVLGNHKNKVKRSIYIALAYSGIIVTLHRTSWCPILYTNCSTNFYEIFNLDRYRSGHPSDCRLFYALDLLPGCK